MWIVHNGIYKDVSEDKFEKVFKERGYTPVPVEPVMTESFEDMKFDELKEFAEKEGIDIKGLRSKADLIAAIGKGKAQDD